MADTLVLLHVEHRNFLRVLAVLDALVDDLRSGASLDQDLMNQVLAYFQGYPDTCHHPKEDLVFRRLSERAPELAARIGDLLGDHDELATVVRLTARRARLHATEPNTALVDDLVAFSVIYKQHLRQEETVFFPLVENTLSANDWAEVDFSLFDQDDPVFDADAEEHYRRLRHAIFEKHPPRHLSGEA